MRSTWIRIATCFLAGVMMLSCAACGSKKDKDADKSVGTQQTTELQGVPEVDETVDWKSMDVIIEGQTYQPGFTVNDLKAQGWEATSYSEENDKLAPAKYNTVTMTREDYVFDVVVANRTEADLEVDAAPVVMVRVGGLVNPVNYAKGDYSQAADIRLANGVGLGTSKEDAMKVLGEGNLITSSEVNVRQENGEKKKETAEYYEYIAKQEGYVDEVFAAYLHGVVTYMEISIQH